MSYGSKLLFAFLFLAFTAFVTAFFPIYYKAKEIIFQELASQAVSIAASVSLKIPPASLEKIQTEKDRNTPSYLALKNMLEKEKNVQKKHGVFIEDILIVRPRGDRSNNVVVVVDAPEDPSNIVYPGQVYQGKGLNKNKKLLHRLFSPEGFIKDNYGTWLIGYAPIFSKEGEYQATILVSIQAVKVAEEMRKLLPYGFLSFLLSSVISMIISYFLGRRLASSLQTLSKDVQTIKEGNLEKPVYLNTNDEFADLATAIDKMRLGLQEREKLKKNFSCYVSQHILEKILHTNLALSGENKKITVLFTDIRDFTKFAEANPPELVVSLLNEFFEYMLEQIIHYKGTLDKFLGDGIMVEFGSPLEDPNQENNAVLCALGMQRSLQKLQKKWEKEKKPPIKIGIGIHTGIAIVGNIGTEKRMEYTAVGDTVNVAAKIEKKTKEFSTAILISEETKNGVTKSFAWQDLGLSELPGREKKIRLFTIKD